MTEENVPYYAPVYSEEPPEEGGYQDSEEILEELMSETEQPSSGTYDPPKSFQPQETFDETEEPPVSAEENLAYEASMTER